MPQASTKNRDRGNRAVRQILALAEERGEGRIGLDLSNPVHADYLDHVMRSAGRSPNRYPALFKRIARRRRPARPQPSPSRGTAPVKTAFEAADAPPTNFVDGEIVSYLGPLAETNNTSCSAT